MFFILSSNRRSSELQLSYSYFFSKLLMSTSSTSHKDLYSIYIAAHGELLSSSYCCPLYVRYLFGTCPLFYRTFTGHLPDMCRRCYLAVCLFHRRSLLGIIEVFARYYRDMYKICKMFLASIYVIVQIILFFCPHFRSLQ